MKMNNKEAIEQIESMRFQVQSSLDEVEVDVDSKEAEEDNRKLVEAFNMAIKALEQSEWIPVTERLPEKSGLYLVSTGDLVTTLSFCGHSFRTHFADEYGVDAWRPMPEPYKGDTE